MSMFKITSATDFASLHNWHISADLKFCIYRLESVCICWKLLADIITAFEDAFQVGPCPLDRHPDHQHRISHDQLFL